MYCARWKVDMVRCCIIHGLPFTSHSCFTLMPPSVSCLCISVPGGLVSRSSICQHHAGGDRADEAQGSDIKRGMLALVLPRPTSIWVDGHSIWLCMIGTWLLQDRKTDTPPMTNDNLTIKPYARQGRRKELNHPFILHQVPFLLFSPLFFCLSLSSTHFTPQNSVDNGRS